MLKELVTSIAIAFGCLILVVGGIMVGVSHSTPEEEAMWGCFSFDERRFVTTEEELLKDGAFLYAMTPNEAGDWVYVLRDSIKGCMEVTTK